MRTKPFSFSCADSAIILFEMFDLTLGIFTDY